MTESAQTVTETPRAFALPSLSSIAVTPCVPWAFKQAPPENVRKDKMARDAWINNPATRWQVYSLVEGLNENRRIKHVSSTTSESESAKSIHQANAEPRKRGDLARGAVTRPSEFTFKCASLDATT